MRINASRLQWSITHDEMTLFLVVRTYKSELVSYTHAHNWSKDYEFETKHIVYNHTFATYRSFYGGRPKCFDPAHLILAFREWWSRYTVTQEFLDSDPDFTGHLRLHADAIPNELVWDCKPGDGDTVPCRFRPRYSIARYQAWDPNVPALAILASVDTHTVSNRVGSVGWLVIDVLEALR